MCALTLSHQVIAHTTVPAVHHLSLLVAPSVRLSEDGGSNYVPNTVSVFPPDALEISVSMSVSAPLRRTAHVTDHAMRIVYALEES